ncbi:uncharacterized protein ARB_07752 [Trichophyton benhamiae CBS 112371]|uniref:Uncharacterized protein n=1 Tax=Arthroderma benhamiae (strain ATCC MYA-4681 / CBS 112371) TaxID=663331 RepID=D4AUC2_ARTBC|nr:uncharacterized protein ARB_07752 [Trichophyton benhamiae CBS 112371]EFE33392.1 hypothetical protein ARB_07752 [Trichophyton benhamiae CBS 112371]
MIMVPLNLDFSSSFVFVVFVVFVVYSVFIAHFVHFLDLVCSSGRKFQCEQRRSGSSSSSRFNGSQ